MSKILMLSAAFAFTATAAVAAPASSMLANGAAVTTVTGHATAGIYHVHAPKKAVIFDSIGSGGYNCCGGWTISGPSSQIGESIWTAIQVTPTASGKLKTVVAGIGYVTGNNAAELAVYSDNSGVPGTLLWSADVSNLPSFGSTGTTTVSAKVKKPKVLVTANTPIWIAVQTDSASSNTWDAWNESNTTDAPLAQNDAGAGWTNFGSNPAGAVTLLGTAKK